MKRILLAGAVSLALFISLSAPLTTNAVFSTSFGHVNTQDTTPGDGLGDDSVAGKVLGASALTESQIQAILSLLQSFGVDQATYESVKAALYGTTPPVASPTLVFDTPVSGRSADVTLTLPRSYANGSNSVFVVYIINPVNTAEPVSSGALYGATYSFGSASTGVWKTHLSLTQAHEGFATNPGGVHWFPLPAGSYKIGANVYPSSPFKPGTDMEYLPVGTEPAVLAFAEAPTFFLSDGTSAGSVVLSVSSSPPSSTAFPGTPSFLASNILVDATGAAHNVRVPGLALIYTDNIKYDPTNCQVFDGALALTTGTNVVNPNNEGTPPQQYGFIFDTPLVVAKGTVKTLAVRCNISGSAASGSFNWGLMSGSYYNITDTVTGNDHPTRVATNYGPTVSILQGGAGALSITTDASTPGYQIVAGGASNVTLAAFRYHATGEAINLNKIGLTLSTDTAYPGDLASVALYAGANQIGTAYFAGNNNVTTSVLTQSLTIPKDSDQVITVKGTMAGIGIGQSGRSGDLIKVYSTTAEGTGASSGSVVKTTQLNSGPESITGVRLFKSYPIVMLASTLPSTGVEDGRLMRFTVTAPYSPIGLGRVALAVYPSSASLSVANITLYAYTDSSYSSPVGGVNSDGSVPASDSGSWWPSPSFPIQVPAGNTRYFEVRGTVSGATSGSSVTTTLLGDSSYGGLGVYTGAKEKGYFIWSPNSTSTSIKADADWTNAYGLPGLPASGLTFTRSGTGGTTPTPPPTCNVTASPTTIISGQYTNITWSSTNATYAVGPGGDKDVANGSGNYNPATTKTYGWTFYGTGGTATCTVTITVTPGPPTAAAPTCKLTATQTSANGGNTTITWSSTNATSLYITNIGNAANPSSGLIGWLVTFPETFTGTATGPGGTATCSVTATPPVVVAPSCSLSVSPSSITSGQAATLFWSSTNATSLTVNGTPLTPVANGSKVIYPTVSSNYTGVFTGSGGSANCYASITVVPATPVNNAPGTPIVTVPTKAYPNTVYGISFRATDPDSDQVRFGIDDGYGSVHWWEPGSGYVGSGSTYTSNGWTWPSIGSRTYQVVTEDSKGMRSAWSSFTVNVVTAPTGTGGGGGGGGAIQ